MAPDELEWWRADRTDDSGVRADERTRMELDICLGATRVLAVGPRLYALLRRDLSVFSDVPEPVQLDPGFDLPDNRRPVVRRRSCSWAGYGEGL